MYRIIDFKRNKFDIPAKVSTIEYDPNRSARIALLTYADGEKRYILHCGRAEGRRHDRLRAERRHPAGQRAAAEEHPLGTLLAQRRAEPGKGGQIARSAGSSVQLVAKEGDYASVKMPSSEIRKINMECFATIGPVGNIDHENVSIGKAGRSRWLGQRPHVRGVAMNPVDHPLGGGEGKTSGGRIRSRRGACRPRATRRATARPRIGTSFSGDRSKWDAHSRRAVRRHPPAREGRGDEPRQREEGHQDLVAALDGDSRDGRAYAAVHNGRKFIPVYVTRTWSGTSSASSRRRGCSRAIRPRWRKKRRRSARRGGSVGRGGGAKPAAAGG
jgi:ribosomal protein L2